MRRPLLNSVGRAGLGAVAGVLVTFGAVAGPNSWVTTGPGNWGTATNWSSGQVPGAGDSISITNGSTKTVSIDSGTPANSLTVSNLTIATPGATVNTLNINTTIDYPPVRVLNNFRLERGGAINVQAASTLQVDGLTRVGAPGFPGASGIASFIINSGQATVHDLIVGDTNNSYGALNLTNGTLTVLGALTLGAGAGSTGTVVVAGGGTLSVTNGVLSIGNNGTLTNGTGVGTVTVSNATITGKAINLGSSAGGLGSLVIQSNGVVNLSEGLTVVSGSLVSTSSVVLSGGSLTAPDGLLQIGPTGSGQLLVSGGDHTIRQLRLGSADNTGSGFLHITGGRLTILGLGDCPSCGCSANFILVDGGDLDGSGTSITIGDGHDATATLSGSGHGLYSAMYVGITPGFTGRYQQAGGIMTITTQLIVGDCSSGAPGVVALSAGTLYVTNADHTAVLDVRNGTFTLNAGATLVVDNLIVANTCGHFVNNGGVLTQNNPPTLDPDMDADGDGQSNAAEAAAGTDPLAPASVFKLTSIARANSTDIRVDWTTMGGHSYVVQVCTNATGGVSSNLVDCSPVINVGGSGEGTTSYTHVGGAAHRGGYYRVRLGP